MKFLIYGAGALGQGLGTMLACAGHRVDLILRERFIETIGQNGLKVTGIFGNYYASPEKVGLLSDISQAVLHYDYVLITTKSFDTDQAVMEISKLGERASRVVSMQNGCGNIEKLTTQFGERRSLGARVITGFEIIQTGTVNITVTADAIHIGGSAVGSISQSALILADILTAAGHPAIPVENIHTSLFAKLLYNCALNPLGAILGVPYGELAKKDESRIIMNAIIDETFKVIKTMGGALPWENSEDYKEIFYSTLIPATRNHRSSMLQDLENEKPTEVDALVGYVVQHGKLLGVRTETCDLLANLVKFKE